MRVPRHFLRIPRIYAVTRRPHHGPVQSPDYPRLASITKSQGYSIFPWHQQARWSEYLSGFNLVICFCPGKLGTKPNALTSRWDVYLKEGNNDYASINPQNYHPVFTSKQLALSLQTTTLSIAVLCGSLIMDPERLHSDIWSQLQEDPISTEHLDNQSDPQWTLDPIGLLCHLGCIYVLNSGNLLLCVLQFSHNN